MKVERTISIARPPMDASTISRMYGTTNHDRIAKGNGGFLANLTRLLESSGAR
jgi:hypothetical protein